MQNNPEETLRKYVRLTKATGPDVRPLFLAKSANEWIQEAKQRPIPKQLFSCFWYEGEVCILFADTNVGKSILAVQVAHQISAGISTDPFNFQAGRQPVLYFDFELSDKQFENRYSEDYTRHFEFDDYFIRLEIDAEADTPDEIPYEQFLMHQIEQQIKIHEAHVLVIDNLTWLRNEIEKSRDALGLMKGLQALKKKHNLSILILAHTPKRDPSRPLTRNDLQGSRSLLSFADSCFAIGESFQDRSLRYLKQIKCRYGEFTFDAENVLTCRIEKTGGNFLEFRFAGYDSERAHLRQVSDSEADERERKVIDLFAQGKSLRAIADEVGLSHPQKVKRIIDRAQANESAEPLPF